MHGCPPSPPPVRHLFQSPDPWQWAKFLHTVSHVMVWALLLSAWPRCWGCCWSCSRQWVDQSELISQSQPPCIPCSATSQSTTAWKWLTRCPQALSATYQPDCHHRETGKWLTRCLQVLSATYQPDYHHREIGKWLTTCPSALSATHQLVYHCKEMGKWLTGCLPALCHPPRPAGGRSQEPEEGTRPLIWRHCWKSLSAALHSPSHRAHCSRIHYHQ